MYDVIIIGSGPAGLSAAITARARGKSALVISNNRAESGFYKAREIDNYPGFPGVSGAELSGKLAAHAQGAGAALVLGRVTAAMASKSGVSVSYGGEAETSRTLILALGIVQTAVFPGETELLGRGVSYCATCDGMLYRGKRIAVVCLSPEAESEAEYLRSIGCEVTALTTDKIRVNGDARVESVTTPDGAIPCDGVFILRKTIAPATLLPGLALEDGHIAVNRGMSAGIPGVFAAGDCAGAPYQIAKAVGEGQIAALSAVKYIDEVK
jgi:thioredoxin reductase (NADPH)